MLDLQSTKGVHKVNLFAFGITSIIASTSLPDNLFLFLALVISFVYHAVMANKANVNGIGQGRLREGFATLKRNEVMWGRYFEFTITFSLLQYDIDPSVDIIGVILSYVALFGMVSASEHSSKSRSSLVFYGLSMITLILHILYINVVEHTLEKCWLAAGLLCMLVNAYMRRKSMRLYKNFDPQLESTTAETMIVYHEHIYGALEVITKVPVSVFALAPTHLSRVILVSVVSSSTIAFVVTFAAVLHIRVRQNKAIQNVETARSLLEFDNDGFS